MTEKVDKELKRIVQLFGLSKATIKIERFYRKTIYYLDGLAILAVCRGELWPYY